jgi:hypothetical protein
VAVIWGAAFTLDPIQQSRAGQPSGIPSGTDDAL